LDEKYNTSRGAILVVDIIHFQTKKKTFSSAA